MRDRVHNGQVWVTRRRRGARRARILSVHRPDRCVVAQVGDEKLEITFSELRRLWRQTEDSAAA
jgi:hypothetical protein